MFSLGSAEAYRVYRKIGPFQEVWVADYADYNAACRAADRETGGLVKQNGRVVYIR